MRALPMSRTYHDHMLQVCGEHKTAIRLLTAIHEGDDSVMPEIHAFLKKVKDRVAQDAHARSAKEASRDKRQKTGRKNSGLFEVAPRLDNGRDYGDTGLILARKGNLRLIWRNGSRFWVNQLEGYTYSPGNLVMSVQNSGKADTDLTKNHRNAGDPDTRLTRKLIEKFAEQIDAAFGPGTADAVKKLDKTYVVTEEQA